MKNFSRALKLLLQRRFTLACSIGLSFIAAALWGGNIGALFPIIEVTFQGRSLQQWVDSERNNAKQNAAHLQAQIARLTRDEGKGEQADASAGDGGPKKAHEDSDADLELLRTRLAAEQAALRRAERLRPYIYRFLPRDPFRTVIVVVLALLAATAVKNVFFVASQYLTVGLVRNAVSDLRRQFYEHALRMDAQQYEKIGAGRLTTLCDRATNAIGNGMQSVLGGGVHEPFKMLTCFCIASFICWRLLALTLLLAPVAALLTRWIARRIRHECDRSLHEGMAMNHLLLESFGGLQTVQSYTLESEQQNKFRRVLNQVMAKMRKVMFYKSLARPFTEMVGVAAAGLAILAGAYLVLNEQTHIAGVRISNRPLSLSSLLVFYGLLIGMHDPARKLADIFSSIQIGCAASDRVYRILDEPAKIASPMNPTALPNRLRRLSFHHVRFRFGGRKLVLRDVDFQIGCGETTAVVGPNGCGKSTLAALICRFYDPTSGCVRYSGVDLREVDLNDLRGRIALVSQKTILFDDTVLANIQFGKPGASHEKIIAAAEQARIHQFIEKELPQGYHTNVGENGCQLSSGQRQRIALARAFLRDPELLVLDEATSHVDPKSERLIREAIQQFVCRRTVLIITHRRTMLSLANRILVMNEGQIIAAGTHDELISSSDFYRRLFDWKPAIHNNTSEDRIVA